MNSLITKYAREVKNADGQSALFLNEEDAKAVSEEVVNNHKADIAGTVDFDATWNHFDINHNGLVWVMKIPQVLSYLTNSALEVHHKMIDQELDDQ